MRNELWPLIVVDRAASPDLEARSVSTYVLA